MRGGSGRLVPVLAGGVLVASARRARTREVSPAEERVFRTFNGGPDAVHVPVWAVMQSGSLAAVFVVSGALVHRGRRRSAAMAAVVGTAVWGGVKAVKPLIGRGRPARHLDGVSVRGKTQTGLGYPSGHAAVSMTLALIATRRQDSTARAAAVGVAGFTSGARMYVGAHLPLDVAGGLALGALCGGVARAALDRPWRPAAGRSAAG